MISVIIPVYNEASFIGATVRTLRERDSDGHIAEIIVVDGGSSDETAALARSAGAQVVVSPRKGRAAQMNCGAAVARGAILYFLHADTVPPSGFADDVVKAYGNGYPAGCFMLRFDDAHWFLKLNCWFTQFNMSAFHYGDASLYVAADLFREVRGFREDHIVFEDYNLVKRLKEKGRFFIVRRPVLTSARKYRDNGIFKMQAIFYLMYLLYRLRLPQHRLVAIYRSLISQDKI